MGEVYKAIDTRLDRRVALKVVAAHLSDDPIFRRRFEQEAARSDVFAFGAVLHEMATGQRPFQGETRASLIAAILEEEPRPISALDSMTPPRSTGWHAPASKRIRTSVARACTTWRWN